MILANKEAAEKFNFNKAIFPGTQGGPLEHVIAAKAVCFGEALKPEFRDISGTGSKKCRGAGKSLRETGL